MSALQPQDAYAMFVGDLTEARFPVIADELASVRNNGWTLHLAIHSTGGTIAEAIAFYNLVRGVPLNLVTYNIASVQSAAVIMFLAGAARVCAPEASFMMHNGRAQYFGDGGVAAIQAAACALEMNNATARKLIEHHASLTPEQWGLYDAGDLHLSAIEGVQVGIATHTGHFSVPPGHRLSMLGALPQFRNRHLYLLLSH